MYLEMYGQWMQLVKQRLIFVLSDCLQSPCRQGFSFFAPHCQPCAAAFHQILPSCCICWKSTRPGMAQAMPGPCRWAPRLEYRLWLLPPPHQQWGEKITLSIILKRKMDQTVMCSWWQTLMHPIITVLWWDSVMDSLSSSIFFLKRSFSIGGWQSFHVL